MAKGRCSADAARQSYKKGVEAARAANDKNQLALQLTRANNHLARQEYADAEALVEESARLCDEIGNVRMKGANLGTLGLISYRQGKLVVAKSILKEAIEIAEKTGDDPGLARRCSNLAQVFATLNESVNARLLRQEYPDLGTRGGRTGRRN